MGRCRRTEFIPFYPSEGTEHDVDRCSDLMPLVREGGLRAIWFGIEDMTAVLTIDKLWKFRIRYQVLGNHGLVRSAGWAA